MFSHTQGQKRSISLDCLMEVVKEGWNCLAGLLNGLKRPPKLLSPSRFSSFVRSSEYPQWVNIVEDWLCLAHSSQPFQPQDDQLMEKDQGQEMGKGFCHEPPGVAARRTSLVRQSPKRTKLFGFSRATAELVSWAIADSATDEFGQFEPDCKDKKTQRSDYLANAEQIWGGNPDHGVNTFPVPNRFGYMILAAWQHCCEMLCQRPWSNTYLLADFHTLLDLKLP